MKPIHTILLILLILLVPPIINGIYQQTKPFPDGVNFAGPVRHVHPDDIQFLADITYYNHTNHTIFDQLLQLLNTTQPVLIDMFLFNQDFEEPPYRPITQQLTDTLAQNSIVITDGINNFYGSYTPQHFQQLTNNNIQLIITDMSKMRDSNPLYSAFHRSYLQWMGIGSNGRFTHPLGNPDHTVTLRSLLYVINARANHRKVAITDTTLFISSANPHDASSKHSNVALIITDPQIAYDAYQTERSVAAFSGTTLPNRQQPPLQQPTGTTVQLLTEQAIRDSLLTSLQATTRGDSITLAMFYLSDRRVVKHLIKAANRGVDITIVLDPNKDAFGREKNGIPNRQVAYELHKKTNGAITIRWYDTQGEQFHTKMLVIQQGDQMIIYLGSANFTRRNIGGYNLETNVRVVTPAATQLAENITTYLENIMPFTVPLTNYYEPSRFKWFIYWIQEVSGLSTF